MAIKTWNNLKLAYPTQDLKGYEQIMKKFKELKLTIEILINENNFLKIITTPEGDIIYTTSFNTSHEEINQAIFEYFQWIVQDQKNLNLLKENEFD